MNIVTKFNHIDKVYFYSDGEIKKGIISKIDISKDCNALTIKYTINATKGYSISPHERYEYQVHKTKDSLIKQHIKEKGHRIKALQEQITKIEKEIETARNNFKLTEAIPDRDNK